VSRIIVKLNKLAWKSTVTVSQNKLNNAEFASTVKLGYNEPVIIGNDQNVQSQMIILRHKSIKL